MIEPFKYLIQPVAVERDESGRIVAEHVAQTVAVYTAAEAVTQIEKFERELAHHNDKEEGNEPDRTDNGRAQADLAERSSAGRLRQP